MYLKHVQWLIKKTLYPEVVHVKSTKLSLHYQSFYKHYPEITHFPEIILSVFPEIKTRLPHMQYILFTGTYVCMVYHNRITAYQE